MLSQPVIQRNTIMSRMKFDQQYLKQIKKTHDCLNFYKQTIIIRLL